MEHILVHASRYRGCEQSQAETEGMRDSVMLTTLSSGFPWARYGAAVLMGCGVWIGGLLLLIPCWRWKTEGKGDGGIWDEKRSEGALWNRVVTDSVGALKL